MHQSAARSRLLRCTATAALMLAANAAQAQSALPTGGTVTTGTATIASDATSTTVTQTSNRATVNFTSFDVAQGNSVRFNQPDVTAATLARVTGTAGSTIAGQVNATGTLYLVNPNGIAITSTGAVQTGGGFVASTLAITDANFNAGTNSFAGTGASARITNSGAIAASGFAALLGGTVSNAGSISVPAGRIALGSGEAITLDINGANFLSVATPTAEASASGFTLIESAGTITGGRIELTGASAADATRNIVNVTGTINADSATGNGGTILLSATGGGRISGPTSATARATGTTGNGGTITLAGGQVSYTTGFADTTAANGTTGTTVVRVPGSYSESAAGRPSTTLAKTNLSIVAGGDITTPFISWQSSNALSLTAGGNIALGAIAGPNGTLNLSAGGGVAYTGSITNTNGVVIGAFNLTNGNWAQNATTLPSFSATDFRIDLSKTNFLRVTGGSGTTAAPYMIADAYGLQGIASGKYLANSFAVANAIDARGTKNWYAGKGFVSIGTDGAGSVWNGTAFNASGATGFTGAINGNNYAIDGLTINRMNYYNGLVGYAAPSAVAATPALANLTLTNVLIFGGSGNFTGAFAGYLGNVAIANSSVKFGSVTGGSYTGGLVGLSSTSITNSNAGVTVSSSDASYIGGLAGAAAGVVSNAYATGDVNAGITLSNRVADNIGGLVGSAINGTLTNVYATGVVSTYYSKTVGGLIGLQSGGSITATTAGGSYATGSVNGSMNVGGLVGQVTGGGTIANARASGSVKGISFQIGGLVGYSNGGGAITTSTASGTVSGSNYTGGLVGYSQNSGAITASTASGAVSGGANVGGLVGYANQTSGTAAAISGTSASGAVTGSATSIGGLVGNLTGYTIDTSFATGTVVLTGLPGSRYVGGLVGQASGNNTYTGSITSSYATGNVSIVDGSGAANVGGLVGRTGSTATVSGSYATGTVTAGRVGGNSVDAVGGLIGYADGAVTTSFATGTVTAAMGSSQAGTSTNIGGLIGWSNGAVSQTWSSGSVLYNGNGGTAVSAGGLIGYAGTGSVAQSYATGAVTFVALTNVGGLIGRSAVNVSQVYASGAVGPVSGGTTPTNIGGVFGAVSGGNISAAYWDTYSTGQTAPSASILDFNTVTAVTSDPTQIGAANYAFSPNAYSGLSAAAGLGTANPTGFAIMPGGVRPFLAFEVPVAGNPIVRTVNGAQTILTTHQLQLIGYNAPTLAANYRMTANIDLAETGRVAAGAPGSYAGMWAGTGFVSLGTNGAGLTWDGTTYRSIGTITSGTYGFSGSLTGVVADSPNRTLANLFINRGGVNNTGLFGTLSGTVTNLGLTGVDVTGGNGTGALAGMTIGGPVNSDIGATPTITLVSAAGRVTGAQVVGGLIGSANRRTTVRAGAFAGAVTGTNTVGGLVGYTNRATVDGFTSGSVTGQSYVGGVVGYQLLGSSVGGSSSTVTGTLAVGGVVGVVDGGTASATSIGNTVNGPSSEDRNFGRVQNGGTVRSPTP